MAITSRTSAVTLPGTDMAVLDLAPRSLWLVLGCIVFNPAFWNAVARQEHQSRWLTHLFGDASRACYAFAATLVALAALRDYFFLAAIKDQPVKRFGRVAFAVGTLCLGGGNLLVLWSIWQLGVTGAFFGDYFGIVMKERVTAFPFNTMDHPMYIGSTLCFLGTALRKGSPAGILISVFVYIVYLFVLAYEAPFTAAMYATRDN
ncbi:Phosphatidyl-N-methylethanolamine N-methyltransferase [Allomyces javanicus]|nr:Phosphatidyl-N-methylethanolamine N-methyltransferase [Allomyces javanicus]